jgi:hypothetical protein
MVVRSRVGRLRVRLGTDDTDVDPVVDVTDATDIAHVPYGNVPVVVMSYAHKNTTSGPRSQQPRSQQDGRLVSRGS